MKTFLFGLICLSIGIIVGLRKLFAHVFKRVRDFRKIPEKDPITRMQGALQVAELANAFFLAISEEKVTYYEKKEFDRCLYKRAKKQLFMTQAQLKDYKHYSGIISSFLSKLSECEREKHDAYVRLKKELQRLNKNIKAYESAKRLPSNKQNLTSLYSKL